MMMEYIGNLVGNMALAKHDTTSLRGGRPPLMMATAKSIHILVNTMSWRPKQFYKPRAHTHSDARAHITTQSL